MIAKETFRTLIKEGQEEIGDIQLFDRMVDIEPNGRYVFVGIRQAGKSYLLFQQAQKKLKEGHDLTEIVYINFDDERLIGMTADDFDSILQVYGSLYDCKPILFFDEIQNVDGWEHFARRLANQKYSIYITGSNARMLSHDILTIMGGRYLDKWIWPYSFGEYVKSRGVALEKEWQYGKKRQTVQQLMAEYFLWGGFPELQLYRNKRSWLNGLYEKILLGDVAHRNGIRNELALRLTMKRIAENVNQPVSYNRIANLVKSSGVSTSAASIMQYVGYAKDACILFSIENYNAKFVEKETVKKHYFADNGLLSIFLTSGDASLLENLCAIHLYQKYAKDVYFYNQNIEVDFFVPDSRLAVQACYYLHGDSEKEATFEREVSALVKLNERFPCKRNLIVTYDEEVQVERDGVTIEVLPVWKWLLTE